MAHLTTRGNTAAKLAGRSTAARFRAIARKRYAALDNQRCVGMS